MNGSDPASPENRKNPVRIHWEQCGFARDFRFFAFVTAHRRAQRRRPAPPSSGLRAKGTPDDTSPGGRGKTAGGSLPPLRPIPEP